MKKATHPSRELADMLPLDRDVLRVVKEYNEASEKGVA